MRNSLIRSALIVFLMIGFNSLHAVNDDGNDPCFGSYSLGWLDASFFWREGTTWYKLSTNDFYSVAEDNYACHLSADTADKEAVAQSSVPAVCEAASCGANNSCLVFATKQYAGDSYRFYRVNLGDNTNPADWSYVETWLGSWAESELGQRVWDQMVFSTSGGLYSPLVKIYTNYTDIQSANVTWDPSASNWDLYSLMKETEVQIRTYIVGIGYVWIWYDTDNRSDSFKQFRVNITKGSGEGLMAAATETILAADREVAEKEELAADLPMVVQEETVKLDGMTGIFPALFRTTAPANDEDTEISTLKIEEDEKGAAVALTVERVDPELGSATQELFEGKSIVAVNGITLYDLGNLEDQLRYLATEDIVSVTFSDQK